ncbi:MAG: recombination mediator RecR [Victivallaceae bacterium]|nr:recombination mediator RecR [Victivallaceae bacterium]
MEYPEPMLELIDRFRKLPGIGRHGAARMLAAVWKWKPEELAEFGRMLSELHDKVDACPRCGALADKGKLCDICSDVRRDASCLCVVEDFAQLRSIEKSGAYHGLYHILGGKLSPASGEFGEHLRVAELIRRASAPEVQEVILALSSDVEGRGTAIYLAGELKACEVTVSTPALGMPAGASFSYADGATIAHALERRDRLSDKE